MVIRCVVLLLAIRRLPLQGHQPPRLNQDKLQKRLQTYRTYSSTIPQSPRTASYRTLLSLILTRPCTPHHNPVDEGELAILEGGRDGRVSRGIAVGGGGVGTVKSTLHPAHSGDSGLTSFPFALPDCRLPLLYQQSPPLLPHQRGTAGL